MHALNISRRRFRFGSDVADDDLSDHSRVQVSVDHVPSIRAERERIESMGGMVRREGDALTGEHGPYRVWRKDGHGPGLAMSRSLGDLNAHKVTSPSLTPHPFIYILSSCSFQVACTCC